MINISALFLLIFTLGISLPATIEPTTEGLTTPEPTTEPPLTEHDALDRQLALAMYPDSVGQAFDKLVLKEETVTAEDFWIRYFWRCCEKRIFQKLLKGTYGTGGGRETSSAVATNNRYPNR